MSLLGTCLHDQPGQTASAGTDVYDHLPLEREARQLRRDVFEDQIILELKFRYGLPALFKYLVEEFALTPTSCSKYRLAAAALGIVNGSTPDAEQISQPQYA